MHIVSDFIGLAIESFRSSTGDYNVWPRWEPPFKLKAEERQLQAHKRGLLPDMFLCKCAHVFEFPRSLS